MNYNVSFDYMVEEFGEVIIEADDTEQATQFAREYVLETYPEACTIIINEVKEV